MRTRQRGTFNLRTLQSGTSVNLQTVQWRTNDSQLLQSGTNDSQLLQSGINDSQLLQSGTNNSQLLQTGINDSQLLQSGTNDSQLLQRKTDDSQLLQSGANDSQLLQSGTNNSQLLQSGANDSQLLQSGTDDSQLLQSGTAKNFVGKKRMRGNHGRLEKLCTDETLILASYKSEELVDKFHMRALQTFLRNRKISCSSTKVGCAELIVKHFDGILEENFYQKIGNSEFSKEAKRLREGDRPKRRKV